MSPTRLPAIGVQIVFALTSSSFAGLTAGLAWESYHRLARISASLPDRRLPNSLPILIQRLVNKSWVTPQRLRRTLSLWDMFGLLQHESLAKPSRPRDEVQIT